MNVKKTPRLKKSVSLGPKDSDLAVATFVYFCSKAELFATIRAGLDARRLGVPLGLQQQFSVLRGAGAGTAGKVRPVTEPLGATPPPLMSAAPVPAPVAPAPAATSRAQSHEPLEMPSPERVREALQALKGLTGGAQP